MSRPRRSQKPRSYSCASCQRVHLIRSCSEIADMMCPRVLLHVAGGRFAPLDRRAPGRTSPDAAQRRQPAAGRLSQLVKKWTEVVEASDLVAHVRLLKFQEVDDGPQP